MAMQLAVSCTVLTWPAACDGFGEDGDAITLRACECSCRWCCASAVCSSASLRDALQSGTVLHIWPWGSGFLPRSATYCAPRTAGRGQPCKAPAATGQGLAIEPVVTIAFNSAPLPQEERRFRWHGAFDARTLTIRLNDTSGFRAWGFGANGVLGLSFLHHELAHLAVHLILAQQSRHLPRHWDEFIAYAVQFELTSPVQRDQILAARAWPLHFEAYPVLAK